MPSRKQGGKVKIKNLALPTLLSRRLLTQPKMPRTCCKLSIFTPYILQLVNELGQTCQCHQVATSRAVTKALIGGGGWIGGRSVRRISFEISCHYN